MDIVSFFPLGVSIPVSHDAVQVVDRDAVFLHHLFGGGIVDDFIALGVMGGVGWDRGGVGPDDLGSSFFQ